MAKQCRYVKKFNGFNAPHFPYCACISPNGPAKGHFGVTNDEEEYPVMGVSSPPDGWYKLCVEGNDGHGVTPSQCKYYK